MFNTIQIIKSSEVPLYMQLANGLAGFIEEGQLSPGTKLPSIRSLARELGINRDTVVSAYKVLENKNLTYGRPGRGTFVKSSALEPFSFDHKDLINFSSTTLMTNHCSYDALIKEIHHYFSYHSIHCQPEQVRISQGIAKLMQALPKRANRPGICIESPCNDISIFTHYGFESFEVPLHDDGMDLDILERYLKTGKIQYIFLTPYLQNPTGICYSTKNKKRLLALAKKYDVYIIENETYSDLLLEGIDYAPIYSYCPGNRVIYIKHFSRLYLPGLDYSFVILPNPLTYLNLRPHLPSDAGALFYHYLHSKIWKESNKVLVQDYVGKYLKLRSLIDLHLSPYFSYNNAYGGIYIWLTLKTGSITIEDLCDRLVENHILISPASLFYTKKTTPSSLRLSIGKTDLLKLEKGIILMASILSKGELK